MFIGRSNAPDLIVESSTLTQHQRRFGSPPTTSSASTEFFTAQASRVEASLTPSTESDVVPKLTRFKRQRLDSSKASSTYTPENSTIEVDSLISPLPTNATPRTSSRARVLASRNRSATGTNQSSVTTRGKKLFQDFGVSKPNVISSKTPRPPTTLAARLKAAFQDTHEIAQEYDTAISTVAIARTTQTKAQELLQGGREDFETHMCETKVEITKISSLVDIFCPTSTNYKKEWNADDGDKIPKSLQSLVEDTQHSIDSIDSIMGFMQKEECASNELAKAEMQLAMRQKKKETVEDVVKTVEVLRLSS